MSLTSSRSKNIIFVALAAAAPADRPLGYSWNAESNSIMDVGGKRRNGTQLHALRKG